MSTTQASRATTREHRLKHARQHAGLTQQQLAARVGANRVTIAKLETGLRQPSMTLARRIADELGEDLETLFGGDR